MHNNSLDDIETFHLDEALRVSSGILALCCQVSRILRDYWLSQPVRTPLSDVRLDNIFDVSMDLSSQSGGLLAGQRGHSVSFMIMDPIATGQKLAPYACLHCKKRKRKCTRELPVCLICRKTARACQYGELSLQDASTDDDANNSNVSGRTSPTDGHRKPASLSASGLTQDTQEADQSHSSFPALFFIDNFTFNERRMRVRDPHVILPQPLIEYLSPHGRASRDVDLFFSSVHSFLPIGAFRRCPDPAGFIAERINEADQP